MTDKQQAASDSLAAEMSRLVAAATPSAAPEGRKQRVRARLAARPRPFPWARGAAFALAGIIVALLGAHWRFPGKAVAPARVPVVPVASLQPATPKATAVVVPPATPAPLAPARPHARPRVSTTMTPTNMPALPAPEEPLAQPAPSLIFEATRSLRRDHNPTRALDLLADYRRREPDGEMMEECMALVIEAEDARGNSVAARRAAQAYLQRFSTGRFRERALRVLGPVER